MALSGQEPATEWVGKVLVDREGAQIGVCTAVLADEDEGVPQWLAFELGRTVWLPASGAAEVAQVTVSQAEVASAPIAANGPPSEEEQLALSRHYRVGPGKADARRRRQVLAAGGVVGMAVVAGAVLARRQIRAGQPRNARQGQPRNARQVLLRAARGVVSAASVMTAPAAAVVANVATRGARLTAAGTKRGIETGATVRRAGSAAARRAAIRAAQVTAATRASAAAAGDSGVRGGKRVGEHIGSVPEAVSKSSEQLQNRGRVMGKITAALTLGVGYVLGARAGRERYDQLKQSAAKLAQRPEVQQARERVQAVAGEKLQKGTGQGKQLAANARQRAMDVRAKVRPSAASEPGPGTDMDPYAVRGTGIPGPGMMPPEAGSAPDPLASADPMPGPAGGEYP